MKEHFHNDKSEDERPRVLEQESDVLQVLYGPPPTFNPSDNVPEDIYGPPSAFGMPEEDPIEEPQDRL